MAKLKAIFKRLLAAEPLRLGRGAIRHADQGSKALPVALLVYDDTPEHERGEW